MKRYVPYALGILIVNSAYLAAFAQASIFYEANVLLHLGLGLVLAGFALKWARKYPRECGAFVAAAVPAIYLAVAGNTLQHRWALWLHIALALTAVALIGWRVIAAGQYRKAFAVCAAVLVLLPASMDLWRRVHPDPDNAIVNPTSPPLSMDQEGAGARSPFAPSSAQTNTGNITAGTALNGTLNF